MDMGNAQGAPLVTAILVLLAIVFLSGMSIAFQGNVHF